MKPFEEKRLILIHGLEGSSQGDKAVLLRGIFPGMLTPDFRGTLAERMELLQKYLSVGDHWTIVGSSLGGLMAAIFTIQNPQSVRKLVLLAPALFLPEFDALLPASVETPTVVYHGRQDTIVPLSETRPRAEKVFRNLIFNEVEDDHRLFNTVHAIDWRTLLTG